MNPRTSSPARWAIASALVLTLAALLSPARAGFLTIAVDPGSTATFSWDTDGDGVRDREISLEDVNEDGKITFGFGTLELEAEIGSVWVVKKSDENTIGGEVKLDEDGNTLASLEPFDLPSFASTSTVVASIDMVAFLAAGNPFTLGQVLNVTNGTIAQSPHIIFKDGSSLPPDPAFSRNLVASLPNFTGTVRVFSFDSAAPPEPSPVVLSIAFAQRPIGRVAVLTWPSAQGATYKVQYRNTLSTPAAWQDFEVVTATGATSASEVPLSLAGAGAMPNEMFFRLVLSEPAVSGVEPAVINAGGGQIFISGQSFAPGDVVLIGGVAMPTNFLSPTLLLVVVPPLAAGIYDVEIRRGDDVIASLSASLTVTAGLALETFEPPTLPPCAPIFRPPRRTPRPTVQGSQSAVVVGPAGEEIYPDKYGRVKVQFHWDREGKASVSGSGELLKSSVDLQVPGRGLDFTWATTYRSRNGEATTMGNNWTHSYDIRVAQSGAHMLVRDGTGRRDLFFLQSDGSFSKRGFFRRGTLAGTTFTLEFADKGRWVFRPLDGSLAAGKIAQSIDRNGNTMQFNYDLAGQLAEIIDTLGRPYQVLYDGSGRVAMLLDFSGRSVVYSYYGAGNPLGASGMLRAVRSPLVTGTPTGNNFPTGKTTTFTYSTGQPDPRLDNNLLMVTDPKGQTSLRFTYAPTPNPADVEFDRVVSVQRGNPLDPIDKPSVFTWLAQTPSPANGYARLKLIANDPVGNVTTQLFESRNLLVTHIQHTGRSMPGVAVTETTNLPAGQLRAGDPQSFTTRIDWNLHFLPERITRPRGNARLFSWESDFNPGANPRELGNLRTLREVGTAGEVLTWRFEHLAGFGTGEWQSAFAPPRLTPKPTVQGTQTAVVVGPAGEEIFTDKYSRVKVQFHWDREGKKDESSSCWVRVGSLGTGLGMIHIPRIGQEVIVDFLEGDPDQPIIVGSVYNASRLMEEEGIFYLMRSMNGGRTWQSIDRSAQWPGGAGVPAMDTDTNNDGNPDQLHFSVLGRWPASGWVGCAGCHPSGGTDNVTWTLKSPTPLLQVTRSGMLPAGNYEFCTSITDPRGHTTTATYDAAGNLTRAQSPIAGTADDFTYNAFGQLTSHLHPANGSGSQRLDTFAYHNAGPQNGYLANAVANAGGLNLTTSFEWNPRGALVRTVNPRGDDTLLTRNQLDEVVRASSPVVNGARNERDFIIDANGNVERVDVQDRNENGALGANTHFSRTWSFDFLNFPTQRVDEIDAGTSRATQFAYDGNRNLTLLTLPEAANGNQPDNVVRYEHDERDLLFRTIGAPGAAVQSTTQFDYGLNGRLTAHRQGTESAPRVTLLGYDGHDRFVSSADALANVRALTLDEMSNVTRMTVTGNAQIAGPPVLLYAADYSYNALNLLTQSRVAFFDPVTGATFGDGLQTTTLERAPNQQRTGLRDENNTLHSFAYDTANRAARITDPRGNRIDFTLDANGNTTAILWTDKRDSGAPDEQFQRTFVFDPLNRLASAQDNVGNVAFSRYDSRGNLKRFIDPRGTETISTFDGLSRLVRRVEDMDASGNETPADITRVFTYDHDSRLTNATDDNGNATTHTYDALNRATATQRADGTTHGSTYDVHHNVVSSLDANGTAITFTHDLLNRLTRKDIVPGGGVSATTTFEEFFHDGMSRTLRAANDGSTVDFTYDSLSNVRSETTGGLTTASTYDAVGNRLSVTYPSGTVLTYSHDVLDRVTAVNEGALTLASHLYAGADRIERTDFGNGTRMDVAYDGQLGGPVIAGDFGWRKPVLVSHTKVAGGAVIDDRAMTWDRNQNKITRNRPTPFTPGGPTQTRLFDYDADDRVIHSNVALSSGPMLDTQYQLDGEGNRVQVIGGLNPGAYTRDPTTPVPADAQRNQYTTTPFDGRQYDENGNVWLTNPSGPNGLFRFMTFDYANQLVSAQISGGFQAQYRHDALGRRIERTIQQPAPPFQIVTRFVYDGERVIEERDGGGALVASYTVRGIDSQSQQAQQAYSLVTMRRGGQDYWLPADDNGNVLALTNAAGTVAERYDYDDKGEVQFLDPAGALLIPGATQSAAGNPYLFRGLRYEPEPRFFLAGGSGYWDPQAGRFIVGTGGANGAQIFFGATYQDFRDTPIPAGFFSPAGGATYQDFRDTPIP